MKRWWWWRRRGICKDSSETNAVKEKTGEGGKESIKTRGEEVCE